MKHCQPRLSQNINPTATESSEAESSSSIVKRAAAAAVASPPRPPLLLQPRAIIQHSSSDTVDPVLPDNENNSALEKEIFCLSVFLSACHIYLVVCLNVCLYLPVFVSATMLHCLHTAPQNQQQ